MEQTKNRWALKVVLVAVFAFAMTLTMAFGIIPGTTLTAHAETYHDQYVDRSTIQDGDVFCADQNISERDTKVAIMYFIDRIRPKQIWEWLLDNHENMEYDSVYKLLNRLNKKIKNKL